MLIELDHTLIDKIKGLTLDQFLVLSLALDNLSKIGNQVRPYKKLLSLVNMRDMQDLIDKNYITLDAKGFVKPTDTLYATIGSTDKLFEEFNLIYPDMVIRPDGTKAYLKGNKKKCRAEYLKIIRGSESRHKHITGLLNKELSYNASNGKMGYMKTMWKWLVNAEWEAIEGIELQEEQKGDLYGQSII